MIQALPAIVERHPEVLYTIAGRTHPDVAHREGEQYRVSLEQAVLQLGLESYVEFDDRFLTVGEIADLLAATDVFVTPYRGRSKSRQVRSPMPLQRVAASSRRPTGTRRTCLPRAPAKSCRSLIRRRSPTPCVATSKSLSDSPRPGQRHAPRRRSSRGRRWQSRPRRFCEKPWSWRRAAADRWFDCDPRLVNIRTDHLLTLVDDVGDRAARAWSDSKSPERLLRRRRRATGGCRARTRPSRRRAGLDVDRLPLAGVPPGRDRRAGRDAELHGLRSPLARRASPRRPCRPLRLGARRHPLDRLGARRRGAYAPIARCDRRDLGEAMSLRTGAYAALGLARLDADRLAARAATTNASRRPACERLRGAASTIGAGSRTGSPTTTPAFHTR